ncbi:Mucin-associated surface protein (MASP) subgroup S030 [Trypanosoma cruzi]|uniref:Mucin-associated surface protein (MASP) subgroup S030 n=1 Tax=Trypanosoma cruzi TaxID=5693 RepID=A0A7J6XUJ4_TRYCR|nr:Mucin-associated surface protein (MASP) subgroup S030 [Trypanosoma cruzi]
MHETHTTVCVDALLRMGACALESFGRSFFCVFLHFLLQCCLFTCVLLLIVLCVFSVYLLRGVVCFCPFTDFSCLMVCARCCFWAAAICDCAVRGWVTFLFLLLLSLCVDVFLVCAEGCTQVAGVMAMMMTGRVLLVCALCVLWCGTPGGRCAEEKADEFLVTEPGGSLSGGEGPPKQSKNSSPVPGSLGSPPKPQKDDKSENLHAKESLEPEEGVPLKTQEGENKTQVPQDGVQNGNQSIPHEQSPNQALPPPPHQPPSVGSDAVSPGGSSVGGKDPLGSSSSGVISSPHGGGDRGTTGSILSNAPSSSPKGVLLAEEAETEHHSLPNENAAERGNVGRAAAPGSEGPSPLEERRTQDGKSEAHQTEESSEDLNKQPQGNGKVQNESPNADAPRLQTPHGGKPPETKGNNSHNTDISTNLPDAQEPEYVKENNNENPASIPDKAQGTSTGIQEEAPASHPNVSPSPLQQENFSGMKTTENVQPPDAAATEKRQTGDNEKVGDSDGSTAVSHTTSPLLLLLLVVACVAAAAVVAA